jgi:hypothetical protein
MERKGGEKGREGERGEKIKDNAEAQSPPSSAERDRLGWPGGR